MDITIFTECHSCRCKLNQQEYYSLDLNRMTKNGLGSIYGYDAKQESWALLCIPCAEDIAKRMRIRCRSVKEFMSSDTLEKHEERCK